MADGVAAGPDVTDRRGPSLSNSHSRPERRPFSETVFGHHVDDPYRWMERPEHADEVREFLSRASEHALAQLRALPGWPRLRERMAAAMRAGVRYRDVWEVGGRLFYRRLDPDAEFEKLVVREPDGSERVLYDPDAAGDRGAAINSYSVSPDAATVAFHTATHGSEMGAIRFIDVASGRTLDDRLEPVYGELLAAWLDERTLAYGLATHVDGDPLKGIQVMLHRLGGEQGPCLLGMDAEDGPVVGPHEIPGVEPGPVADWVVAFAAGAHADSRYFVARRKDVLAGAPGWREVAAYEDRAAACAVRGDTAYLITTIARPNGEVVAVDLAAGAGFERRTPVFSREDLVLTGLAAGDDGLYVLGHTDGVGRLFLLADGGEPVEVALPLQGTVHGLRPAGAGGVTFTLMDWFTAPRVLRARAGTVSPTGIESHSFEGVAGARQERRLVTSADGTQVPLVLLLPPDHGPGPAPTLLEGYGSYGIMMTDPYYLSMYFGFLLSGGVIALCGTRGGGERGRGWHDAGRAANKPNAHADLIAAAEELVRSGVTRPDMLTVAGASAGALLAPPVAMKRPDLFAGLVARVPALNPTRLEAVHNGAAQYAEMGDPTTPEGFEALLLQDSYLMLDTAPDLPDTMLVVGLNDVRVPSWMAAKFAARALERFGDRRLVLVRADQEGGHGVGHGVDQWVDDMTDMFAFVLNRAGAEGFTAVATDPSAPTRGDGG